ncbi:MAG: hypothetical protein R3B46_05185 [Phycisphaerales bacterium]
MVVDIATMQQVAASMSMREQGWVLFALMAGVHAVKVPLFPVHAVAAGAHW